MTIPVYALDATGLLAANRVKESVTIGAATTPDVAFVVPRAAPFFKENFKIYKALNEAAANNGNLMVEGVDYILTHYFVSASLGTGKQIFGSVTMLTNYTGPAFIDYQTLGGTFVLDAQGVVESLTRSLYNIYTVTWDQLEGVPAEFPVVPHFQNLPDTTSWGDLINKWEEIRQTLIDIFGDQNALLNQLNAHITAPLAHGPQQVGLDLVFNGSRASQVEAEAGTVHNKYMTPLRTAQAIAAIGTVKLNTARTIALVNDVVGSTLFDGSANVNIAATLADRFRFIENLSIATIDSLGGQDPNTSTQHFFLTRHVNTPDADNTKYWFIVNVGQGANIGSVTRRAQIATEWFNTPTTKVLRLAARVMNTSNTWGPWSWISNHRDIGLVDGRRYGTPYVDQFNLGVDAAVDTILETFCRITIASENLNGLERGDWYLQTFHDNDASAPADVANKRIQIATTTKDPNVQRNKQYFRSFNGSVWTVWSRIDGNGGIVLDDTNIDNVVVDGDYRQKDAGTILDLLARGYPVQDNGSLIVVGFSEGLDVGTRQLFYPSSSIAIYQRRQLTNTPTWTAWTTLIDASGNVPQAQLPVVDIAHGGTNATNASDARDNLGLQNGAITNFIVSATEPVSPPANTIWLKPVV